LRHIRWLEFLKDYDVHFQYHSGKAKVIVDALSHRPSPTLNHLLSIPIELCEEFKRLEINVTVRKGNDLLFAMKVQPTLIEEIRAT